MGDTESGDLVTSVGWVPELRWPSAAATRAGAAGQTGRRTAAAPQDLRGPRGRRPPCRRRADAARHEACDGLAFARVGVRLGRRQGGRQRLPRARGAPAAPAHGPRPPSARLALVMGTREEGKKKIGEKRKGEDLHAGSNPH